MKLENDLGEIRISSEVFTAVTGSAATNCYGVKGMAVRSKTDGLVHLLKRESMAKGVKVYYNEDGTVSGDQTGTWQATEGSNQMTITLTGEDGDVTYNGAFDELPRDKDQKEVMTFSAVGNNVCIWGSQK